MTGTFGCELLSSAPVASRTDDAMRQSTPSSRQDLDGRYVYQSVQFRERWLSSARRCLAAA